MKRFLLLVTLALVVFVVVVRQRLFVRDPLASVTRDGVKLGEAHASINFTNDVLLYDDSAGRHRIYLMQNWNKLLTAPAKLICMTKLACLTDADHATGQPIVPGVRGATSETMLMSDREVSFVDEEGKLVKVTLR